MFNIFINNLIKVLEMSIRDLPSMFDWAFGVDPPIENKSSRAKRTAEEALQESQLSQAAPKRTRCGIEPAGAPRVKAVYQHAQPIEVSSDIHTSVSAITPFLEAAASGNLEETAHLAKLVADDIRGCGFSRAIMNRHSTVAFAILDSGSIPAKYMDMCAYHALMNKDLDLAMRLLGFGEIRDTTRKEALRLAISKGNTEAIEFILNKGGFDGAFFFECIQRALENEQGAIVLSLLARGEGVLSEASREELLRFQIHDRRLEMVRVFVEKGGVSPAFIEELSEAAARSQDRDLLRALLPALSDADIAALIELYRPAPFEAQGRRLTLPSITDVQERPLYYLEDVATHGFPDEIYIQDSRAVDAGGPSRQFISTLFQGLRSHLNLPESRIPIAATPEMKPIYKNIGAFYSQLSIANRGSHLDRFLTGPIFNTEFFSILKTVLNQRDENVAKQTISDILCKADPNEYLNAALTSQNGNVSEKQLQLLEGIEVGEVITAHSELVDQALDAAKSFIEGCSDGVKALIRLQSSANLSLEFQGEPITRERLLSAIRPLKRLNAILSNQYLWVQQVLRELDEKSLEAFVMYVTGSDYLQEGTVITLQSTQGDSIHGHSCSRMLDLPAALDNEADFKAAFIASLSGSSSFTHA